MSSTSSKTMRAPDGSPASGVGCGMLRGESRTGEKKGSFCSQEEAFVFFSMRLRSVTITRASSAMFNCASNNNHTPNHIDVSRDFHPSIPRLSVCSRTSHAATPVEPKPPAPRSVSSRSSHSTTSGVMICSRINCATRSPTLTSKSSLPWLKRITPTLPR